MKILLTDEEIERAYRRRGYGSPHVEVLDPKGVAQAQLKKVVGLLRETNRTFFNGSEQVVLFKPDEWQALLKEVDN